MTKHQLVSIVKNTVKDYSDKEGVTFTRDMKWAVFLNCCDNMLSEHRITAQQHKSWTHPF